MKKSIVVSLLFFFCVPVYSWAQFFGTPEEEQEYSRRREEYEDQRDEAQRSRRRNAFQEEDAYRQDSVENTEKNQIGVMNEQEYETGGNAFNRNTNQGEREQQEMRTGEYGTKEEHTYQEEKKRGVTREVEEFIRKLFE